LEDENKEEKIALLSYRPDRIQYKEAIMTNNPNLVLGKKNSFLGFHILDLPKKVIKLLKRKLGMKTFKENPNIKSGKVAVAPYGGMFLHKKIIDVIGYPKEEFFVYADDHEWSYRITKSGGNIILVLNSKLKDIDTSWNITSSVIESFDRGSAFRIYYSTRNRIIFEKRNLITKDTLYSLNMWFYKKRLQFFMRNKNNFKVFKKAVNDGLNNKLGKIL
jgi:GT2 family glycosyltransferase